jgi:hypothetical protein
VVPRASRTLGIAVAAGVLGAALAGALAWRVKPVPAAPVRRLDLAIDARLAELSPDGTRIAYASGDRLFVSEAAAHQHIASAQHTSSRRSHRARPDRPRPRRREKGQRRYDDGDPGQDESQSKIPNRRR